MPLLDSFILEEGFWGFAESLQRQWRVLSLLLLWQRFNVGLNLSDLVDLNNYWLRTAAISYAVCNIICFLNCYFYIVLESQKSFHLWTHLSNQLNANLYRDLRTTCRLRLWSYRNSTVRCFWEWLCVEIHSRCSYGALVCRHILYAASHISLVALRFSSFVYLVRTDNGAWTWTWTWTPKA